MYSSETSKKLIMTNENISPVKPWFIWGLAAFFYFYENCLQVSPAVMVPELMRTFKVDAAALGAMSAFYFYAYAGMQIPVGVLLDKYGARRLLTLATAVCAMGSLIFGLAFGVGQAELGRLLIGFGSAFAAVACMKLAATWFPLERFALLTGLMLTVGLTGSIVGETPLALLVGEIGWRGSMLVLASAGAILLVAVWYIVRDKPTYDHIILPNKAEIDQLQNEIDNRVKSFNHKLFDFFSGLIKVLSKPQSWLVAIYGGLMFAPTSIFGALWGVPFLMQAYNLSRPSAASLITFLFLGWVVGSPILGWISDRIGKRKPTMYWGAIIGCISMLLIIYMPHQSKYMLAILLFIFGYFSSGFLPAFSIMREISPAESNATALGFMNMLNMIGGAVGQPLVGHLLDLYWGGNMAEGIRLYSTSSYHIALASLPIMMGLSLLILPFVRETYCKTLVE